MEVVNVFSQFSPGVWEIALDATYRTLKTRSIPKNLITVHLRRGDFKVSRTSHRIAFVGAS